jgi:hypothetical protein
VRLRRLLYTNPSWEANMEIPLRAFQDVHR